jgi:hypothetical protein
MIVNTQKLYDELLYAVERKFPNETRHQTALRYIQETEKRCNSSDPAVEIDKLKCEKRCVFEIDESEYNFQYH